MYNHPKCKYYTKGTQDKTMTAVTFRRLSLTRALLRACVGVLGVALAVIAVALYFRWPMVADVWPWRGYYAQLTPLSYFFLSSIVAAVSVPTLWIAVTGRLHAATAGAMDLVVSFTGIAIFMFQRVAADPSNTRLLVSALVLTAGVAFIVATYLAGRNMRGSDTRPLPAPVRVSFYVFIVALLAVGGQLILKTPNILPWQISPEGSVVYGWLFLGASVYFIYAVARPTFENATGPLLGFLAYDIVLILPFIRHFSEVQPQHVRGLIVYTIVVVYSALLAIYYLFVNRSTRLTGQARPA